MWHQIERWGSDHPVLLGGAIFIIGAILIYLMTRGSSKAPQEGQDLSGYYTAQAQATQAGNAFQAQQVAAQAAIAQAQLGLQAVHERVAGDIEIGKIDSQTALGVAGLQTQVAVGETAAGLQLGTLQSTLSAQVAQAGFDRDVRTIELNTGAMTAASLYAANVALGQAGFAAQIAEGGYAAQVEQARIQSGTALGQAAYGYQTARDVAAYGSQTALGQAAYGSQTALGQAAYGAQTAQLGYGAQVQQALIAAQSGVINRAYDALGASGGGVQQFITPLGSGEVAAAQAVASIPVSNVFQPNFYAQPIRYQ